MFKKLSNKPSKTLDISGFAPIGGGASGVNKALSCHRAPYKPTCHSELVSGSQNRTGLKSWIASLPLSQNVPLAPFVRQSVRNDAIISPPLEGGERISTRVTSVRNSGAGYKAAFTLAEILITLGIIGVVAAITLPALITNIQDRIKEKRVQNIQQKFSKATDKMLSVSGLNGYDSTLDFVNELKNHLSIAKICENDELRNCWPTEKVTLADGKEWNIADTKKAKNLKMEDVEGSSQWDDTVGLITGDGTSVILSYNKLCDIEPTATSNWTSDKSSSTNCIAAVFDWNGSSKPNQFGTPRADVLALNAIGLGQACIFTTSDNKCLQPARRTGADDYLTYEECNALKGNLGIKSCCASSSCREGKDYWAWAVSECGHVNNMASMEDLGEIATKVYGTPIGAYAYLNQSAGKTYDSAIASSLGLNLPTPYFVMWSGNSSYSNTANARNFGYNFSDPLSLGYRYYSDYFFMCKTD